MGMTRQLEKPDDDGLLTKTIRVGEAWPDDPRAGCVVRVINELDLESLDGQ
jgi:hypothetical protein